ncbi:unnamed protein product [Linum trigynum]|uniref:Secreted protein n=1 Tax=Linum trigynum TaxID=586398 RepID=A0AAV2D0C0_9ROSI
MVTSVVSSLALFQLRAIWYSPVHRRVISLVVHCDGSSSNNSQEAACGVAMFSCHGQACIGRAEVVL